MPQWLLFCLSNPPLTSFLVEKKFKGVSVSAQIVAHTKVRRPETPGFCNTSELLSVIAKQRLVRFYSGIVSLVFRPASLEKASCAIRVSTRARMSGLYIFWTTGLCLRFYRFLCALDRFRTHDLYADALSCVSCLCGSSSHELSPVHVCALLSPKVRTHTRISTILDRFTAQLRNVPSFQSCPYAARAFAHLIKSNQWKGTLAVVIPGLPIFLALLFRNSELRKAFVEPGHAGCHAWRCDD